MRPRHELYALLVVAGWLGCTDSRGSVFVSVGGADAAPADADLPDTAFDSDRDTALDAAAGESPLLLYLFDEGAGAVVRDRSGVAPLIDLDIDDAGAVTWLPGGGLRLDRTTRVRQTRGDGRKIVEPCRASRGLSVEAWVTPLLADQQGPARIIALSQSSDALNFTLAQGDDRYVQRLRTTATDLRGDPRLEGPAGGPRAGQLAHLLFTHQAGDEQLFIDGVARAAGNRAGTFANWANDHRIILGNEHSPDVRDWVGTLHRVAVWCRRLSETEVRQRFEAGPRAR